MDKLSKWLCLKKSAAVNPSDIKRVPADQKAPLSFGQLRLWFLQQMNPGNPFYHYAERYLIQGDLKKDHFIDCFKIIVSRHDILRTTFPDAVGEPWQQINEVMPPEIFELDLRSLGEAKKTARVQEICLQQATKPFDLVHGPLIRLGLFQWDHASFQLILVMHHIIADQWSLDIIREEWATLYRQQEPGPPEEFQYADLAYNQRQQKINQVNQYYWEQKLSGDLPKLELPLSKRKFKSNATYKGSYQQWVFPTEVSGKLRALCSQTQTTMFVLMLSVFKTLLYRYTGESDLLVATPVTNRDKVRFEKMIGFFNETIVLRDKVAGQMCFLDLIKEVQATVLEAFAHKNIPFESIVKSLRPERMISSNPLFQFMFLYHKITETPPLAKRVSWEHSPLDIGVSKFELTLHISEDRDQISAAIEYAHDLFTTLAIEKMQGHLNSLISGIIEDPGLPLSKLPLVTETERTQILSEWNHSIDPSTPCDSVMDLIETAVKKYPARMALVSERWSLRYDELDLLAGTFSSILTRKNIGPGDRVGICTEKSPEMIVGMLAVLKAGATYVPMDSNYPLMRLKYMISDAEISVIMTQEHLKGKFSDLPVTMVPINPITVRSSNHLHKQRSAIRPSLPAYIMYTSGSTGLPKGVEISHCNLLSSTLARTSYYPQQPESFLLMSSFSFDSSVAGIFWTLCSGGKLVLPKDRIEQDMTALSGLIDRFRVTHTLLLPSLYNTLLQHGKTEQLGSLNTVIVAGEPCSAETCANHFKILPKSQLYNEYGPTEATVWSSVHKVLAVNSEGIVPIGVPIKNSRIYLLDNNLDLVPAGVPGELFICGDGVSPGYINLPALTSSRFIPSPFKEDKGHYMYKTGDLGRYTADGLIEFLGRADRQIKLRGYRVEPDEISKVFMQFPGVNEAAVLLKHTFGKDDSIHQASVDEIVSTLEAMDPEEVEKHLRTVESIDQFNFTQ